ncbi:MAG: PAS domain S-box protein, partial [Chloroflexi bacterium]|nr:PAS domain S-box protein [Chloroflexota bacterium]
QGKPIDYIILQVNPLYEKLLGLKRDQVVGRLATAAYGVTEAPYLEVYARVAATGKPARFETYFTPLDRFFDISVISTGPGQFATMFVDISQQKQAQVELSNVAKFPEENPYPVMRFRRDGQILYANAAGRALLATWERAVGDLAPAFWCQVAADVHANQSKRSIDIEQDERVWSLFVTAVADTDYVNLYGRDITERVRAEQALRESEARFRQAVLNAPVPMMIHDEDDQIYQLSQGWTKYSGYTLADIPTMGDWTERAYGQRSGFAKDYIDSLFQIDETVSNGEWVIQTRDGQPRTWDFYTTPLSQSGRGQRLLLSIAVDVTDRKRVENEIRALNAELEQRVTDRTAELSDLYNNAPCGYHSLDADGRFVRVNDTELTWLGYSRAEIVGGLKFADLLTPASVRTFQETFPAFKERGWISDLEFEMVRKDGSRLPVLLSATAVRDAAGHYLMSRSTIVDHTERHRAEEAMRLYQSRLEAAYRELEAFSYSISHDLRAPLRALDGFSRILLEDHASHLDAAAQRYLHIVRRNAQQMGQLIDDLLVFSRLSRQPLNKQPVDLTALITQVLDDLRAAEGDRSIEITIGDLPPGQADLALLKQVLINLIANALKFTAKRTSARIEIGCKIDASTPIYFVSDNGAGFDMQYADKLFGVFQRLHRAEDYAGTGVGLAIVKRIIERHGGRVWADAREGEGATFYFTLGVSDDRQTD